MFTLSAATSLLSLLVSVATLWLVFFSPGKLKMTKPTVIYFGSDASGSDGHKVYFRALLYSTAKRGVVVEQLYVRMRRGETVQNFSIWVHGDGTLSRGSGMFIGQEGVVTNHHFLQPPTGNEITFTSGLYEMQVFARIVGRKRSVAIGTVNLDVSQEQATFLRRADYGLYFDWGPESETYHAVLKPSSPQQKMGKEFHQVAT